MGGEAVPVVYNSHTKAVPSNPRLCLLLAQFPEVSSCPYVQSWCKETLRLEVQLGVQNLIGSKPGVFCIVVRGDRVL